MCSITATDVVYTSICSTIVVHAHRISCDCVLYAVYVHAMIFVCNKFNRITIEKNPVYLLYLFLRNNNKFLE